ncbi:imidazolonepropionase [Austwickia chelonae]|uniref:imidazolonepropionase n=1 Tax=Austwickia chelonae TaxID=100225 RepID=UPI000E27D725|nr:imidazolonepropionase [Austwickia chelonae]
MSVLPDAEVITGIGELWTVDDRQGEDPRLGYGCGVLADAAVVVEGGVIVWVGPSKQAPAADRCTDVDGRAVLPGWVDSHSHLVFAGDRSAEFAARMAGQSYAAGGIGVTTTATREASDEELRALIAGRVRDAVRGGTTYLETKTGYGLSVEQEARSARLAAEAVDEVTFLGAHLVPGEFSGGGPGRDRADYVDLVCGPMLEAVRGLASWADVFCEEGAFDVEESRRILLACRDVGLGLRVHGNQLGRSGGVAMAVEVGAASVDHCNFLSTQDLDDLAQSDTVATVLPACDLSTRAPLAPARALLDAGAVVALASNCNPGTSYTTSMNFCVATAVLQMNLSVAEAVRAATSGGARALRRDADLPSSNGIDGECGVEFFTGARAPVGSVRVGARADLQVLAAPSATHLAYRPGMPLTWAVWREGCRVV